MQHGLSIHLQKLLIAKGGKQLLDALPSVIIRFFAAGQFLQQQAAGTLSVGRQQDTGRQLLGLLKIILQGGVKPCRLQRHQSLIAGWLAPRPRVFDGNRQHGIPAQRSQIRHVAQQCLLIGLLSQPDESAQRATGSTFDEQAAQRRRGTQLYGKPAIHFDMRHQECRGSQGLSQKITRGAGIITALLHFSPSFFETDMRAAHSGIRQQEGGQQGLALNGHDSSSVGGTADSRDNAPLSVLSNGGAVAQVQAVQPVRRWRRRLCWLLLALALLPVLQVLILRHVNPPVSSFMLIRQLEAFQQGDFTHRNRHEWVDLQSISPHLPVALIAAEDQLFTRHEGFDRRAIEAARAGNAQGKRIRGGSTITQQTAKNLFLWSGQGWTRWLRKGLETGYTFLIEAFWPKSRTLELYANFAEFGDGIYGAEAAAKTYFGKPASALTAREAARLAAVLPNPKVYSVSQPGPYVQRRSRAIERQMRLIGGTRHLDELQ